MTPVAFDQSKFCQAALLIIVAAISFVFFSMIRGFMVSLLIAGIFSGMTYPLYQRLARSRLLRRFGDRNPAASLFTILVVLLLIVVPLLLLLGIVAEQAVQISSGVTPWVQSHVSVASEWDNLVTRFPALEKLRPYEDQITAKLAEFAGHVGTFLVNSLAATTRGAATFFFQLFIMLYAMFFFLVDGEKLLDRILYYVPLDADSEERMVDKFVSVTRATLKGTMVIGMVQGALAGAAFAVVGIHAAVFWGTIMAVLSIIPGLGTALVWVPAAAYLLLTGHAAASLGLTLWCGLVVGTVDNFLRPRLVGKDTQMPDLLILLSTLGGLGLFGAIGFVIGPVVAALFVTIWDIYGSVFRDILPPTRHGIPGEEEA